MSAVYIDGVYTSAEAVSAPVFEAPLPHTSQLLILRQKFCIAQANYAPLALNTAHDAGGATYAAFKLVAEGPQIDLGEGIVEWERTYAKKPTNYSEPHGQYTYHFIGLVADVASSTEARDRFSRNVPCVIDNEFFIVGSGGEYVSADLIPLPEVTNYYYALSQEQELVTDYLYDVPPATTPTVPTREEYLDMIAADASEPSSYSIVIETRLERWMGNIWRVSTLRTKAI